jgi:trimethylguanosine synthase
MAHHYSSAEELPNKLRKYFIQRYDLFSRYDEGVVFTPDSWYGVTPEAIAKAIANEALASPDGSGIIVDAFGGIGGNSIAFALAKKWKRVIAFETDLESIRAAKVNAAIYGVEADIEWIHGDFFELSKEHLSNETVDIVFMSPPWGGVDYKHEDVFDLEYMEPYSLVDLGVGAMNLAPQYGFVLFLPRSSDLCQLAGHVNAEHVVKAVNYCINGASKALCVYFINAASPTSSKLRTHIKFNE